MSAPAATNSWSISKSWRDRVWRFMLLVGLIVPTIAVWMAADLFLNMDAIQHSEGGAALGLMFAFIIPPLMAGLPSLIILGIVCAFKLGPLFRHSALRVVFKSWGWILVAALVASIGYWVYFFTTLVSNDAPRVAPTHYSDTPRGY